MDTDGHAKFKSFPLYISPFQPKRAPTTKNQIHTLQIPNIPTTPTMPSPLSSLSPTFNPSNHSEFGSERDGEKKRNKEHDRRRKKLAKLTRTLGENVPPELVLPSPVSPSMGLDTQKDAAVGLACKTSNVFRTKPNSCLPHPLLRLLHPPVPTPILFLLHLQPHPLHLPRPLLRCTEILSFLPHREKEGSAQLRVMIPEKQICTLTTVWAWPGVGMTMKISGMMKGFRMGLAVLERLLHLQSTLTRGTIPPTPHFGG